MTAFLFYGVIADMANQIGRYLNNIQNWSAHGIIITFEVPVRISRFVTLMLFH